MQTTDLSRQRALEQRLDELSDAFMATRLDDPDRAKLAREIRNIEAELDARSGG